MGTIASELAPLADRSAHPRVYADANLPAGVVAYMRGPLGWDVLFVLEHADLRRAPDVEHFRLAAQLRRTLVTLDRDYLDAARFPPAQGAGVLVVSAPDARALSALLLRVHRALFHAGAGPLPLEGRTLAVFPDSPLGPPAGQDAVHSPEA